MSYSELIKYKWRQNEELQEYVENVMRERKELAEWIEKSAKDCGIDVETYKSILQNLAQMQAPVTPTADTDSERQTLSVHTEPDEIEQFFLDIEGDSDSDDDSDSTIYEDADDDLWEFKDMLNRELVEKREAKEVSRMLVYSIPQSSRYMLNILPAQNKRDREEEDVDEKAPAGPSNEHALDQREIRPMKRARV